MYLNYYECHECKHHWVDLYDGCPDDDCPECGARHVGVHHSLDVPEWDEALRMSKYPNPRLYIYVDGGIIEEMVADRKVEALILDADLDVMNLDERHIVTIQMNGLIPDFDAELRREEPRVDPDSVQHVFSLASASKGYHKIKFNLCTSCIFISVWDGVTFRSPALLHEDGSIEITECRYDVDGVEVLEREYLEMPNGSEFPVCSSCHEHVATDGTDECDKCRK